MDERAPQAAFDRAGLELAVRRGLTSAAWLQAASQLVSIGVLAVLMRLVGPAGYGLLGMVFPLLNLLRLFTALGLNVATVQKADLETAEISALFWLNVAFGACASLAAAAAAPGLAIFYRNADVAPVAWAMAATPLFMALGAQHQALLERHLKIGAVARLRFAAQVIGSAASITAAAAAGWGVGALVLGQYVELVALAALAWRIEPWRPARPRITRKAWALLRFGGQYTLSQLVFFVAQNLDKVLVGLWFGERALGWYSQAFQIAQKPVLLVTGPVSSVMLPALARAAADRAAHAALVTSFFRLTGTLLWPCGVGLLIVAPEAMLALGGPEWAPAGGLLRALALTLLAQGFVNLCGSIFAAAGRADRLIVGAMLLTVSFAVAYLTVRFVAPLVTEVPLLQLELLAWAHTGTLILVGVPYVAWCCQSEGVSLAALARSMWPAARAALLMGAIVGAVRVAWLASGANENLALLAIEVISGALVYALCSWSTLQGLRSLNA
jgi:PST family polysaccharide transporter